MSLCAYTRAKCGKVRHITTGGKESRFCGFHIMKVSAFEKRIPKVLSMKDAIEGREKSRLKRLRTMREIENPTKHIANILKATSIVFPRCTNISVKMVKSLANDPPQLTHTDYDVTLINKRVPTLDALHYSVIIAFQE
jgi:hypothetical protein